jgi:hypothetical protein
VAGTKDWAEEDPVVISSEDEREAAAKEYYESHGVFSKWDPEFDAKTIAFMKNKTKEFTKAELREMDDDF